MTKYLETKRNSIEEAISSVVLGENGFVVGKVKMPKMKGGAKLQSKTNFDFRLFDPEDSPGSDKANDEMNREIVKASKMKDKATAMAHMNKIQRKHSKHGATDTEPREVISQVLNRVFGESVEIDEGEGRYSKMNLDKAKKIMKTKFATSRKERIMMVMKGLGTTYKHATQLVDKILGESAELDEYTLTKMDKMMGIKKGDRVFFVSGSNAEGNVYAQNEKEALEKAKKRGIRGKISVRDKGEYKGQPTLKNSVNEGYESEVLKVLKDADIDGYFKMGKLYVSRRDARDAKKALEDSDEITKLPKMVMEDERMKKLTPRQRQALARVQAKPKSQVSLPKMPDFMKPKKEENEMDIVDTIKGIVEKKLDPVNKDAVKKKFDDRKDKDIDNDGDVDSTDKYLHKRRKAISKAIAKDNNEAYDIGKDYAQHTLEVTPGQDKKDVDKMLNVAYTKNQSMRETLAKVWGLDEGKSPFQKEEEKPLTKTMTGQKPTTVKVNPKIEEK